MKVAITGANGFLGSYLTEYLESRNIEVNKLTRNLGYDLRFLKRDNNIKWQKVLNKNDV